MIITRSGITIRMHVDSIRTMGRAAQGVKLINLKAKAEIAAVARVPRSEDEDEEVIDGIDGTISETGIEEDTTGTETGTDVEDDSVE